MRLRLSALVAASMLCTAWVASAQPAAEVMDERLQQVNPLLVDLEKTSDAHLNVPRSHGQFLRTLIEMSGARSALEVGTSNGYSGIWMGLGLERTSGKLTTLEIDAPRAEEARANFRQAGLAEVCTCITGDALEVIPTLKGTYDFVFIDAVKTDYWKYLELAKPKIRAGAVIVAHNAISARDAMSRYFEMVESDPNLQTTVVAIEPRDGMAITYCREKPK